jgi:hypothetical protein
LNPPDPDYVAAEIARVNAGRVIFAKKPLIVAAAGAMPLSRERSVL